MARPSKKSRTSSSPAKASASSDTPSWWERRPVGQQHTISLLLLLAVALGFYGPIMFTGQEIIGGDIVQWRSMAESMIEYREATGEEALWSTNAFSGMPGYLISFPKEIPQADLIPTFLRGFLWPVSHFLFLLFGMYALVFYLTRNTWAGVLAACAYGLTTYLSTIILIAGHNTKFIALCFAPWLVLAFVHALRRPGLLASLLFAIALAVNLRAEHIQITYYVSFALGIWWIVEAVGAVRKGRLKTLVLTTAWLAAGSVLAILMVAHPYLPVSEYKAYSIRGASSGGAAGEGALAWDYAMGWSHAFGEFITLLIADAYGGSRLYWGPKIFTGGPHYVGGIVVALAVLALWRLRRNATLALGIATGLMLLFALGENFPLLNRPMFDYFPLFSSFRVPETWLSAVSLTLAVLAGFGLFYAVRKEETAEAEARKTRALYLGWGGVAGFVLLMLVAKGVFFDFERPGEFEQITQQIAASNNVSPNDPRVAQAANQYLDEVGAEREDAFSGDAMRTLIFLLLAGALLWLYRNGKIPGWTMQAAFVVLLVVDLGGIDRRYLNAYLENRPARPSGDIEAQIPRYDFDQYILEQQEAAGGAGRFRVLSLEGQPTQNARPSYYFESVGGYHGAKLRRYQDYLDHVLFDPRTGMPNETALDLLNVRYIIARGTLPETEVVFQGPQTGFAVLENPDAAPRAFFVGETEVIAEPEAMWARLRDPAFDPQRTALLEAAIDFGTTPLDSASTAAVTLESYAPREIVWQVETDAPRLLVASEVYYPAGWNAYIDGETAPIYPVDYLLRGVPVPAGQHEVVMRFEPRSYRLGKWIAGSTTVLVYGGVLLLLGLGWMRRNRPGSASGEQEDA